MDDIYVSLTNDKNRQMALLSNLQNSPVLTQLDSRFRAIDSPIILAFIEQHSAVNAPFEYRITCYVTK